MIPKELEVLKACYELLQHQKKLLTLLAFDLRLGVYDVFFAWALRQCSQRGKLQNDWCYRFHGLECDFENESDGRFIRLDFGPYGRVDTFTSWGLLQFIMTTQKPWSGFANLKVLSETGLS